MDELLNDFVAETSEHLEAASAQLVQFEIDPTNAAIVTSIFRLVHTIKGTCGFLGLNRLELLTHAAEAVVSHLRDGKAATPALVTLILAAVDRVKLILAELEAHSAEPQGDDNDLISALEDHLSLFGHEPGVDDDETVQTRPVVTSVVTPLPAGAKAEPGDTHKRSETIRVDVMSLERIMVLVSELVLTRNQLLELSRTREDEASKAPMQRLSSLTSDLQTR